MLETEQENKAVLLASKLRQLQCLTKPQIHPPLLYVFSAHNEPIFHPPSHNINFLPPYLCSSTDPHP